MVPLRCIPPGLSLDYLDLEEIMLIPRIDYPLSERDRHHG